MKVYEGNACCPGEGKIAIVVAKFNKNITENLLKGALQKLKDYAVPDDDITVAWVPGAFELPLVAQRFADDSEYQAVICLGCVIKGETPHDEHINRAVSLELARLGVDSEIPVIFGLLTCNTVEQALARSAMIDPGCDKTEKDHVVGNKGSEAAIAALEMLNLFEQLPQQEVNAPFDLNQFPFNSLGNMGMNNSLQNVPNQYYDNDDYEDEDDEDDFEENDSWFVPPRSGKKSYPDPRKKDHDSRKKEKDSKKGSYSKSYKPKKGGDSHGKKNGQGKYGKK